MTMPKRNERIKDLREKKNLTIEDVSEKLGIEYMSVCDLEWYDDEIIIRNVDITGELTLLSALITVNEDLIK